jgi:hypothetical protein
MPDAVWGDTSQRREWTINEKGEPVNVAPKPTPIPPEILVHFKIVCSCGSIIVQCRCWEEVGAYERQPGEEVEIRHGCRACRSDMQDAAELIARQKRVGAGYNRSERPV